MALFGGDDATDLDAYDMLAELRAEGSLDTAICVGVRSDEGPAAIVERADLVVDGTGGFAQILEVLAGPAAS
jgi:trehalose 6-phosphate phosphatase